MSEEQGAEPGMKWSDVAKSAYRAYSASTGNKNYQGLPMPEFEALPEAIKTAWEAAVRQVGNCLRYGRKYEVLVDEQQWEGWVRP